MTRYHAVFDPVSYGTITVPFSPEEEADADARDALAAVVTSAQVNTERDRRIAAGFMFGGKVYDSRPEDQKRISASTSAAFMAVVAGAQAGNTSWDGGSSPFAWRAQDDSMNVMDAQTVVAFGLAAMKWEQDHLKASWALKALSPIPADYKDNQWWPA